MIEKKVPNPLTAEFIGMYFNEAIAPNLGDISTDGMNFLRRSYIIEAYNSPEAMESIWTWLLDTPGPIK